MPSLSTQMKKGAEARANGSLVPASEDAGKPPIPVADYPVAPNSYLRTPLPSTSVQQPDMQRVWQTGTAPQVRVPPQNATASPVVGAQATSQAITVIQKGQGLLLQTNNLANAVQSVLNLRQGSNITLSSDSQGGVTITGTAGGDGLVHGDPIWEHDSAYIELRDDFVNLAATPASASATLGSLGWTITQGASGFTSNGYQQGLGLLHIGEFSWGNTSTSNATPTSGIGTLFMNTTGPAGPGPQTTMWSLLETAGWKVTFVWRLHRLTDPILGVGAGTTFDMTQKSMYVGLATNVTIPTNTGWSRPPIFIGARFDTDTTAPSIGDSTIHLEAVVNALPTATTPTRNNTQGTVFDTGVVPAEDVYYRLDIVCQTVGTVTMSLNGSAPQTFVIPKYTADNSGITGGSDNVGSVNNIAILDFGTIGGVHKNHPFSTGSQVVISGFSGGNALLNGSFTLAQSANNINATQPFGVAYLLTTSTIGANSPGSWQIVGYPALTPVVMWGNDTQAAPVSRTRICVDFFSFVGNAGIANSAAVPNSTKSRYFQ